jgi:hypothetical protein
LLSLKKLIVVSGLLLYLAIVVRAFMPDVAVLLRPEKMSVVEPPNTGEN